MQGARVRDSKTIARVTARDAGHHFDAERLEEGRQDRRCGDPIDVVVAEHPDPPALPYRRAQQLEQRLEAGHADR
jgi:hypothetical protein